MRHTLPRWAALWGQGTPRLTSVHLCKGSAGGGEQRATQNAMCCDACQIISPARPPRTDMRLTATRVGEVTQQQKQTEAQHRVASSRSPERIDACCLLRQA